MLQRIRLGLLIGALAFVLGGCEEEGPAERAGERLDQSMEDVGDRAEEMGDDTEEAFEDAREEFDESVDEAEEELEE